MPIVSTEDNVDNARPPNFGNWKINRLTPQSGEIQSIAASVTDKPQLLELQEP